MRISWERRGEYLKTALSLIVENEGSKPLREIISELPKGIAFSDYEWGRYEKSGLIRWQSILYFYSIDCVKAGWLVKDKGVWYITEEGKRALKLSNEDFIKEATEKYREWKKQRDAKDVIKDEDVEEDVSNVRSAGYTQAFEIARGEIEEYIQSLNPYEFQDLVAALLRGMGYFTPFIAPKGPDGGIDIIAYRDPLGAEGARIKVQVKHRKDTKVTNQEVAHLNGILKNGEVGLIVSSGGFTSEAIKEMRRCANHIEKIDLNDFVKFWEKYYETLSEDDKNKLPLIKVSFLAPEE